MTHPRKALEEDAPRVHEEGNLLAKKQCIRGDADTAIKNSKYVVTRHYSLPLDIPRVHGTGMCYCFP